MFFWKFPTQFSLTLVLHVIGTGKNYSWIGCLIRADKKLICQKTRRARTIPRPLLESSRQGKLKSAKYIFVWSIFHLFFKITSKIIPKQKCTQQIWIRLVKYSSAEVSDPSKGPRIDGKLIFYLVKEVQLICVRSIISCSRVPAIV